MIQAELLFPPRRGDMRCTVHPERIFSVLMRTTMAVLEDGGVRLLVESTGRGTLSLTVTACGKADFPLLRYAASFLQRGFAPLAAEYPDSVGIREETVENSSIEVLED